MRLAGLLRLALLELIRGFLQLLGRLIKLALDGIRRLGLRLLHVKTWEELLSANGTTRHPRGRK